MKSCLLLAFILVNTQCLVSGLLPIRPCHHHHSGFVQTEVPIREDPELTTGNQVAVQAPAQGFIPNILSYLFGPRIRPTPMESTTVPEDYEITQESILPFGLPFDLPLILPGLSDLMASLSNLSPNVIQLPNHLRDYSGNSNGAPVNSFQSPVNSINALNSNPSLGSSSSIQHPRIARSNSEPDNYVPHPKLIAGQVDTNLEADNSDTVENN